MLKGLSTAVARSYALAFALRPLQTAAFPVKVKDSIPGLLLKALKFENPAKDKEDLIQALNASELTGSKVFAINLIPTVFRLRIDEGSKKVYIVCGNPHISAGVFDRTNGGFNIIKNTGVSKGISADGKKIITGEATAGDGISIEGENYCIAPDIHSDGYVERSFYVHGDGGVGKFGAFRIFAFIDLDWTKIDLDQLASLMERIRGALSHGTVEIDLDDPALRALKDELEEYCRQSKNCVTFAAKVIAGIFDLEYGAETQEGFEKIATALIKHAKFEKEFYAAFKKALKESGAVTSAVEYAQIQDSASKDTGPILK